MASRDVLHHCDGRRSLLHGYSHQTRRLVIISDEHHRSPRHPDARKSPNRSLIESDLMEAQSCGGGGRSQACQGEGTSQTVLQIGKQYRMVFFSFLFIVILISTSEHVTLAGALAVVLAFLVSLPPSRLACSDRPWRRHVQSQISSRTLL